MKVNYDVLYRGERHKVLDVQLVFIDDKAVTLLRLKHKKYQLWVNLDYVIPC